MAHPQPVGLALEEALEQLDASGVLAVAACPLEAVLRVGPDGLSLVQHVRV
jgi:hypothetical protein